MPEIKSGDDNYNYSTVVKELLTPLPPLFPDGISRPVVKIACGAYHFLCTTISTNVDGVGTRLYTCGLNNYGQLGHGDTTNRSTMARVTKLDQALVKCIAAGYHHSLVTDNDGNIIAFGRGDYGQLGITDETPKEGYCETLPVYVPLPTDNDDEDNNDPVKEVSCGDHQCFAVTQGGALWSWGYGESSAHGHGNKDVLTPRILDLAEKIKDTSLMNFSEIGGAMGGGQHSVFLVGTEQKKRKRERRSTSESLADRKQN